MSYGTKYNETEAILAALDTNSRNTLKEILNRMTARERIELKIAAQRIDQHISNLGAILR